MRTGGHQSLSWTLPSEAHSGIWPKVTSQTRTCGCPDTLPQFPLRATLRPQGHGAQSPPTQGLGFQEGKRGLTTHPGPVPGDQSPWRERRRLWAPSCNPQRSQGVCGQAPTLRGGSLPCTHCAVLTESSGNTSAPISLWELQAQHVQKAPPRGRNGPTSLPGQQLAAPPAGLRPGGAWGPGSLTESCPDSGPGRALCASAG